MNVRGDGCEGERWWLGMNSLLGLLINYQVSEQVTEQPSNGSLHLEKKVEVILKVAF